MRKLYFKVTQKQYNALAGLRYRIADIHYQREHGADESEIEKTHKTILSLFDELDALKVPFWVQNQTIASVENYRRYYKEYTYQILERVGVDCREVTSR